MKLYDLIIIGGGPAGITAGIYGARENLDILLISKDLGGQMARKAVEIENYPGFKKISGQDLIQRFKEHLENFKIQTLIDKVIEVKKEKDSFSVLTENKEFKSHAVLVSSGAEYKSLGIPGEKEFIGKGVSYCVTCDGILYKDKIVAVIGGGNAGFEAALFLTKISKKVYILEYSSEIKADKINQERARKAGNIEIITNADLKEIKGDKFVESVVYQSNQIKELKIDGVFIEIGSAPANSFVKGLLELNQRGEIIVDSKTGETNIPGLFAAGDITDEPRKQIVVAAGQGAKAVVSASHYINKLKSI